MKTNSFQSDVKQYCLSNRPSVTHSAIMNDNIPWGNLFIISGEVSDYVDVTLYIVLNI